MRRNTQYTIHKTIICIISFWLLIDLIGCEAFVRKFTRKKKKEEFPQEEMVLVPEEYKPTMTKEEQYRQYFLFWKSWQDEVINALSQKASHKRQVRCLEEAIKNLVNLRALLNVDMQKKLDIYLTQLKDLLEQVVKDLYSSNNISHIQKAERIRRNLLRDFPYNKVKNFLI